MTKFFSYFTVSKVRDVVLRYPYVLLVVFSLMLLLPGIASVPALDRDEAHFIQATRQMLQTNNYFQVHFQDITRFQKPPGINWLQALSVKAFSNADAKIIWPYRVPSVLGALFAILLTYFFARRFIEDKAALLGALFLASSLLLVVEAHMAVIDASLLSAVVLMQGALWVIYQAQMVRSKVHWLWAVLFWFGMAYGIVLKGVTPLVAVLSIIMLCVWERRVDWLKGLYLFWGVVFCCLVSLAWLLLLNAAEHSNYLLQMLHRDLLPKLQGGHESHGKPPLFHLLSLPITFWPASLFLAFGSVYAWRYRQELSVRFLIAWILPTWIFFELMPTKLPQYVLPTFPAIALLCALGALHRTIYKSRMRLRVLVILWGIASLGFACSLFILCYLLTGISGWVEVMLCSGLITSTMACLYLLWYGYYARATTLVLVMALFTFPITFKYLLPTLSPLWLTERVAEQVYKQHLSDRISDDKPLLTVGFAEPSLVFYFNTKQILYTTSMIADMEMQRDSGRLLLIDTRAYDRYFKYNDSLVILSSIAGYNYSNGQMVKLLLVGSK